MIHGGLLLNTLPWTFIGVVLSLNVFSAAVLAALVPAVGACLLGLSLAKLWMELAVSPADLEYSIPPTDHDLLLYRSPSSSSAACERLCRLLHI